MTVNASGLIRLGAIAGSVANCADGFDVKVMFRLVAVVVVVFVPAFSLEPDVAAIDASQSVGMWSMSAAHLSVNQMSSQKLVRVARGHQRSPSRLADQARKRCNRGHIATTPDAKEVRVGCRFYRVDRRELRDHSHLASDVQRRVLAGVAGRAIDDVGAADDRLIGEIDCHLANPDFPGGETCSNPGGTFWHNAVIMTLPIVHPMSVELHGRSNRIRAPKKAA